MEYLAALADKVTGKQPRGVKAKNLPGYFANEISDEAGLKKTTPSTVVLT